MFCFSVFLCLCCSQLCFECLQYLHGGKSSLPAEPFGLNHFIPKEQHAFSAFNLSCSLLFSFLKTRHFSSLPVCLFPCSISESFLTVKGAALFLPRGNGSSTPRISHRRNKHAGERGIDGWGLSAPGFTSPELTLTWWHTFVWPTCVLKPGLPVSMLIGKKVFKTLLFKQDPRMSDIRAAAMAWWRLENDKISSCNFSRREGGEDCLPKPLCTAVGNLSLW